MKFENKEYVFLILIIVWNFAIFILSFIQISSSTDYGYIDVPVDLFIKEKKFARNKTVINLLLSLLTILYSSSRIDKLTCNVGVPFSFLFLLGSNLSRLIITSISIFFFNRIDKDLIPIGKYDWIIKFDYALILLFISELFLILQFTIRSFKKDLKSNLCCGSNLLFFISNICFETCRCKIFEKILNSKTNQQMKNQINTLDNQHINLTNSVSNLNTHLDQLKEIKEKEENENKELQIKNQELLVNFTKFQKENENLTKDIDDLDKKKEELNKIKNQLEIDNENLKAQMLFLNNDIEVINQNNEQMEKNKNTLTLNKIPELNEKKKEDMIKITFSSSGLPNTEILCFEDEIFYEIEKRFYTYKDMERLADNNSYILSGGKLVNRFITIKENKIKENEAVVLNIIEDDDDDD